MAIAAQLKKVIFLDRDGVINRDSPDYIKTWDEFQFLPGSLEALRLLSQAGFRLIVITNQSIIGRGMVPLRVLEETHRKLKAAVSATGGDILDIFYCPHRPDEACDCRKPAPGLIQQACRRYGIDPVDSVMIGDSVKDMLCGCNAGCGTTILVRTGNGLRAEKELAELHIRPDMVAADLLDAARYLLGRAVSPDGRR
ncbi:D-glycero-beta-D-manno-heptose 1,7-bisphosphate 7-phosphatase [Desulfatitalea tepidiphila]|uniref:D-glycero-beta-D-manno-heptose 1,7-bisphosphate 7-phosphatase n=1 Tax=Desulfatitalea tepidiphila TaxID=1185843 RepID=UPI00128EE909|nr:D-glycero-beta-D-manno-heptose 1,7-bisphosphate 7-phosphatase [Desulfatitalea tepidiphila]